MIVKPHMWSGFVGLALSAGLMAAFGAESFDAWWQPVVVFVGGFLTTGAFVAIPWYVHGVLNGHKGLDKGIVENEAKRLHRIEAKLRKANGDSD